MSVGSGTYVFREQQFSTTQYMVNYVNIHDYKKILFRLAFYLEIVCGGPQVETCTLRTIPNHMGDLIHH